MTKINLFTKIKYKLLFSILGLIQIDKEENWSHNNIVYSAEKLRKDILKYIYSGKIRVATRKGDIDVLAQRLYKTKSMYQLGIGGKLVSPKKYYSWFYQNITLKKHKLRSAYNCIYNKTIFPIKFKLSQLIKKRGK